MYNKIGHIQMFTKLTSTVLYIVSFHENDITDIFPNVPVSIKHLNRKMKRRCFLNCQYITLSNS